MGFSAALASPYRLIIALRNYGYDRGIFLTVRTPPLVVSVGNIEVGGTGKTPFTIALASALKSRGHAVAIVTRGYRGRLAGPVQVSPKHTAAEVGDEPILMARLTGLPVVKSPDRVAGARYAHRHLGAEIVVLDDAFQHRRIYRDYNICLVSCDLQTAGLLPCGRLREPPEALVRADRVFYTKDAPGQGLHAELACDGLVDRWGKRVERPVAGKVLAFCGIARPAPFFESLRASGADVTTMTFHDHHAYTDRDLERIVARAAGKDLIVTTEKDLTRIDPAGLDERWHGLRVRMNIEGLQTLVEEIEQRAQERRISR